MYFYSISDVKQGKRTDKTKNSLRQKARPWENMSMLNKQLFELASFLFSFQAENGRHRNSPLTSYPPIKSDSGIILMTY